MASVQFQPVRAFHAARILFADPDALPEVFTIIESLSGNTLSRLKRKLESSPAGQRLLATQPDIVQKLADREALARLPEGSLGRAYLDFVTRENISAAGIREASEKGGSETELEPPLDWVGARMRDTHDLWHAVVGYSGDVLGELSLLAFTFAQTRNPGVGLIIALGLIKTMSASAKEGEALRNTIYDGFKRGSRAKWLLAQDWETLLTAPLSEVRAQLNLPAPPIYKPIRSHQLKPATA